MKCVRCGNYLDETGICSCGYDHEYMVDHSNRPPPAAEEPDGQIVLPTFRPKESGQVRDDKN